MGKKKRKQLKPWCWYCDREFEDDKVLINHQRSKHFKCPTCNKRMTTVGGLMVHMETVHKERLQSVPCANPGRDTTEIEIFGMEGVPPADILEREQRLLGDDAPSAKRPRPDEFPPSLSIAPPSVPLGPSSGVAAIGGMPMAPPPTAISPTGVPIPSPTGMAMPPVPSQSGLPLPIRPPVPTVPGMSMPPMPQPGMNMPPMPQPGMNMPPMPQPGMNMPPMPQPGMPMPPPTMPMQPYGFPPPPFGFPVPPNNFPMPPANFPAPPVGFPVPPGGFPPPPGGFPPPPWMSVAPPAQQQGMSSIPAESIQQSAATSPVEAAPTVQAEDKPAVAVVLVYDNNEFSIEEQRALLYQKKK